jgi:hypothetical protein
MQNLSAAWTYPIIIVGGLLQALGAADERRIPA